MSLLELFSSVSTYETSKSMRSVGEKSSHHKGRQQTSSSIHNKQPAKDHQRATSRGSVNGKRSDSRSKKVRLVLTKHLHTINTINLTLFNVESV